MINDENYDDNNYDDNKSQKRQQQKKKRKKKKKGESAAFFESQVFMTRIRLRIPTLANKSRERRRAERRITLHARTPSGCKSGDFFF